MSIAEMDYQYLDLIFMPIITRYTDSEILFRELFDEKVLYEFMEATFGIAV